MGCDYYIVKALHVYYSETHYVSIELERNRGYYYYDDIDEDDIDYEKKMEVYIQSTLTPKMKPILLYDNANFVNISYENKYRELVEDEITKYNKKWEDIVKIKKVEHRYERD